MRLFFLISVCILPFALFSQADTARFATAGDTVLQEVTVEAFSTRLQWKAVPAAVALIGAREINRYAPASLVPVLNTVPGVRMEERSPASYRLSIRGSLLRSPFGIRNIKVYWNDLPLSDGGGNTYLNLVEMSGLTSAEIVKGPVASVYGAGTGGALLMRSELSFSPVPKNTFTVGMAGGSYGLFMENVGWQYANSHFVSSVEQSHQQSDGYRDQSVMRRDAVKWQARRQWKQQQLKLFFFYSDLYYQTPGGITLAQMEADPTLARQAAGAFPGAVQQKAAIGNKTLFGGIHHEINAGRLWTVKTFVTGNTTRFSNPFITNYEERSEQNIGSGINFVFRTKATQNSFQWMNGIEWLYNQSAIDNYGNRSGVKDTVQFKDNVYASQWFAFSQMQLMLGDKWNFTAGISLNNQSYRYKRLTDLNTGYVRRSISAVFTPRVSVLYRITADVSLYVLAAKGFSPPALAELRPSDGNFYGDLLAESGWNYEAGIKGELFGARLQFDLAGYSFRLENAIVRRNNTAGAEYFVNAGGTKQNGMEALLKYQLIKMPAAFFKALHIWSSYSYQPYRFDTYQQGGTLYSGNELTGVPRTIWISGMDIEAGKGFYLNSSLNSTSSLPLTDANDAYAGAYRLLQLKFGYRCKQAAGQLHFFTGMDNVLNESYSLGNDINAAGKRYYNPAAGRTVFAGIQLRL